MNLYPVLVTNNAPRRIGYVRCPTCVGAHRQLGHPDTCKPCDGWGWVVDPPHLEERTRVSLELFFQPPWQVVMPPLRRHIRFYLRRPLPPPRRHREP